MKRIVMLAGVVVAALMSMNGSGWPDSLLAVAAAQENQTASKSQAKWAPQFPRPGAFKILETEDVMVWDDTHTTYDHWHKHLWDTIAFFIQQGPFIITGCPGVCEEQETVPVLNQSTGNRLHPYDMLGRYSYVSAAIGPHNENSLANALPRRVLFVELKRTLTPDASRWSTDPTGEITKNYPLWPAPKPQALPTVSATQKKWPSLAEVMEASGATRAIDNKNVTVWDETLTRTRPMLHKNMRNVIAVQLYDAPTKIINGENASEVAVPPGIEQRPPRKMPSVYALQAGVGPYDEIAADPQRPRRTVWIEIKGSEAADCRSWSTDAACR